MLRWWWRFVALLPAFKHWKYVGFLSILRSNFVQMVTLKMLTSKYRFDVKIYTAQVIETKTFLTSGRV